jgi:hypothetical protein
LLAAKVIRRFPAICDSAVDGGTSLMRELTGRCRFYPSAGTAERGLAMRSTVDVESLSLTAPNAELIAGLAAVLRVDSSRRPWWPWVVAALGMVLIVIGAVLFQ